MGELLDVRPVEPSVDLHADRIYGMLRSRGWESRRIVFAGAMT
jgi:hypothetical protein